MSKKQAPGNTSAQVRQDPMGFLLEAMVMGGSNAILNQEAQGQRSLVNSDTLPSKFNHHRGDYDPKVILEAAGVKFLGPVEGDDMFQYVELPNGWKKQATDHSMWSKLVDDKGRERASIFYKAAFYDRDAFMNLVTRFGIRRDYDRQDKEGVAVTSIIDGGKVVHTIEPIKLPADDRQKYEVAQKADVAATEWLDKNHPDWRNPGAYWD